MNQTPSNLKIAGGIIWSMLSLYGAYTILSDATGYYATKYILAPVIDKEFPIARIAHEKAKDSNYTMSYNDLVTDEEYDGAVKQYDKSIAQIKNIGFFETVFQHKDIEYISDYQGTMANVAAISSINLPYLNKYIHDKIQATKDKNVTNMQPVK